MPGRALDSPFTGLNKKTDTAPAMSQQKPRRNEGKVSEIPSANATFTILVNNPVSYQEEQMFTVNNEN